MSNKKSEKAAKSGVAKPKRRGRPPGIAKRQAVTNATVSVMRRRGFSDEHIEAKLAATRPRRTHEKTAMAELLEQEARAKAELKIMERDQKAGVLVEAAKVSAEVQRRAAAERDALLAIPAREAAGIAVRLSVAESLVRRELTEMIRRFLTERSQSSVAAA